MWQGWLEYLSPRCRAYLAIARSLTFQKTDIIGIVSRIHLTAFGLNPSKIFT
ncbi:hypothetical protein [Paradesulfitobacterium ferrireducens]|uniref:hypothetical protein n=1 Tax=Paradesulfitobacterium ferrireducens TaxID=2816476 RepID=UPI001F1A6771|nr:hypothetical protein [Paradesulfitobacterium ferrireducens]